MDSLVRVLAVATLLVVFLCPANGAEYQYERGGVLFYAGFDGTRDALAVGDGKATLRDGGGAITADGFDSVRGGALRTGDGIGWLEFSATGNILPDEGTIEMWVRPVNWSCDDGRQHTFLDILGEDGGSIRFYQGADTIAPFWVKAPAAPEPRHWEDNYIGIAQTAYDFQQTKDDKRYWQYFHVWKKGEFIARYRGHFGSPGYVHRTQYFKVSVPSPGRLHTIHLGDFGGGPDRHAETLIDEVYIYNRALTYEECQWASTNALTRKQGMDIPANFAQPTAKVVPDPEKKTLIVEVDSGDRSGNFTGTTMLVPASGTEPAPIIQKEGRFGEASIPYQSLPKGVYQVISAVTTKDGKPIATVTTELTVPGPPVWLTEKVGVSNTPPPPWPPIRSRGNTLRVWGREYMQGSFGLPRKIVNQGKSILAGPVELRVACGGKDAIWKGAAGGRITGKTQAQVVKAGESVSAAGVMKWTATAEFDGFMLYDFELAPGTVDPELIELCVPIRKEYATLYYRGSSERGFLPKGTGTILSERGSGRYWWIGTDDFGLCGATEHDGANLDNAVDAFRIVREDNGDITVVYRFLGKVQQLAEPWRLRWVLQATPTKPIPKDWRRLRDFDRFGFPDSGYPMKLAVANPWYNETQFVYMPFPVLKDPDWYRGYITGLHARDIRVLPYATFVAMPPEMPECAFYWREWFNPVGAPTSMEGWEKYAAARLVPSYIDFLVWKHRELAKEYGHDGLYVDFAGVYGNPVSAPEYGLGYVRNNKTYPANFPVVAAREMWKRVYTMFKELKPDSVMVGHVSAAVHAPVLSFCDVWLNGEHNWRGNLRDSYLDVLPLDQLRAAFRAQAHGGIPWWMPEWYGAVLEDKDVAIRQANGQPSQVSIEKSHHLFGLGLLIDVGFWPTNGQNAQATRAFWAVQDKFGIGDAKFFGYWNNAAIIRGQTDEIKASAYKKPKGGALVVVYNVTRQPNTANLTIAWERLKGKGALEVVDAYTEQPLDVNGKSLTIEVPPLNYRLLWIK